MFDGKCSSRRLKSFTVCWWQFPHILVRLSENSISFLIIKKNCFYSCLKSTHKMTKWNLPHNCILWTILMQRIVNIFGSKFFCLVFLIWIHVVLAYIHFDNIILIKNNEGPKKKIIFFFVFSRLVTDNKSYTFLIPLPPRKPFGRAKRKTYQKAVETFVENS